MGAPSQQDDMRDGWRVVRRDRARHGRARYAAGERLRSREPRAGWPSGGAGRLAPRALAVVLRLPGRDVTVGSTGRAHRQAESQCDPLAVTGTGHSACRSCSESNVHQSRQEGYPCIGWKPRDQNTRRLTRSSRRGSRSSYKHR